MKEHVRRKYEEGIKRCKEMIKYHTDIKDTSKRQEEIEAQERIISSAKKELEYYQNKLRCFLILSD